MPEGKDIEAAMEARAGRAAAGVEAAGGMEGAGGMDVDALADALADALETGYAENAAAQYGANEFAGGPPGGWGPVGGAYSPGEQARMDAAAAAVQAKQGAAIQAAMASADPGGIGAAPVVNPYADPAFVDTFATGGYAAQPDTTGGWETFGSQGLDAAATYQAPSIDQLSPGEQQRVDAQIFEDYQPQEWGGPTTTAFDFVDTSKPAGGTQGYSTGVGTGVESFEGWPGGSFAQGTGVAGTGVEAFDTGAFQARPGMLGTAAGKVETTLGPPGGWGTTPAPFQETGMISAGTTGTTTTTPQVDQDKQIQGKVAEITAKVNTPEANTAEHTKVAQGRLDTEARLDKEAKANPNGNSGYPGVSNQKLANSYSGFDTTLAAYATINGVNSLASMIANNLPGVNMASKTFGSITAGLVNMGIFNKTSGEDIAKMIGQNLAAGLRPGMDSQWESGPSTEDVQGPKEISAFIQKYSWAAELDPRYIKYLIDNPAALQDLLGQQA